MPDPTLQDPTTGTWRLKQIGLAKLLHNLAINERTGTLVLKRGEVSKSIFFKGGYVMFAESNLATDRLGEVLCRRGEITRSQLSECLSEAKRTGKMLGAVLVEKQVLRAERLLPAIEVQVREIVLGAFSWDDGDYLFSKEFVGNQEELLDLKIRTADLILEGVRRTYTGGQATRILGDTTKPPRLSAESGYLSQDLTIGFEVSKVLSKIDGSRSIGQIVAETGLTELAVLQILAALAHLKIVDAEAAAGTAIPAAAPAPVPPSGAPAQDVRVRAARVEEMRAHDEVTQLLDRLPPLVSQLQYDPGAATPAILAAAGPGADEIGKSFGAGRRILDVLQERNYTLELVRAVAALFNAKALKPLSNGAPPPSSGGWTPAPATGASGGSSWQVPKPAGIAPPPWTPPGAAPQTASAGAGFPATKSPSAPQTPGAGFPAPKNDPAPAGFPAPKSPGNGAPSWGAPAPAPASRSPSWSSGAIPVGGNVAAPSAPAPAPGWGAPPAGGAPAPAWGAPAPAPQAPTPGWGAPTPAPSAWSAPPAAPAGRPAGPSVWNVPPAAPAPAPVAAGGGMPWPAPASPIPPPPAPAPAPSWAGPSPLPSPPPPPSNGASGITFDDVGELDASALESIDLVPEKKAPEPKTKKTEPKAPEPIPTRAAAGRSRRGLFLGLGGLVMIAGGAAFAVQKGFLPNPITLLHPAATPVVVTTTPVPTATQVAIATTAAPTSTPTAVVAPSSAATATPTPEKTAVAVATTAVATATPTQVAIATQPPPTATPKPTPTPLDPEAARKKAEGLVAKGNEALNTGDAPKAIKYFQGAVSLDPKNAKAYLGMGGAFQIAGDNAKAKKSYQKFLDLAPNDPNAAQVKQILGSL